MAISIQKRYVIAFLAFFGYMFISLLQKSLASAFIDMRSKRPGGNFTYNSEGRDYEITQIQEANTLGFMVTFIGGAIANTYGGAITFGSGIGISGCIAILSPSLVRAPIEWVLRVKYLDGLLQGLAYCGVADLWARWSLMEERARLVSFAMTGCYFGSFIQHIVPEIGREDLIPYSTIFTITGALASVWAIVWLLYVRSDPSKDESIAECERKRLSYRIKYVGTRRVAPEDYPWIEILTSKPVWAIFVASFLNSCGFAVASFHIPHHMLKSGLISDTTAHYIPIIIDAFTTAYWFPAGYICDWARTKYHPNQVHKCFVSSGLSMAAVLLVIYVLFGNASLITPIMILFYVVFPLGMVLCDLAFIVNVIDLSPRYASLISGFEITFFTTGSLLGNYLVRHAYDNDNMGHNILPYIFIAYSILFSCGAVLYYYWANTKLQPWNQLPPDEHVKFDKRASKLTTI